MQDLHISAISEAIVYALKNNQRFGQQLMNILGDTCPELFYCENKNFWEVVVKYYRIIYI